MLGYLIGALGLLEGLPERWRRQVWRMAQDEAAARDGPDPLTWLLLLMLVLTLRHWLTGQ